uniref:Uncharacterized protein n=1 Tax=Rhizophora mucronata TaxID=61149 RepID=A0A2P2NCJ8_RHIMU
MNHFGCYSLKSGVLVTMGAPFFVTMAFALPTAP